MVRELTISLSLPPSLLWARTGDWGLGAAWQSSAARGPGQKTRPFSAEADMRWDWLEELDIDDESEGDGIALISARAPSPPLVQLKGADVGSLPPLRAGSKGQNAEVAQSIAPRFSRATSSSSSCPSTAAECLTVSVAT